MFVDEKDKGNEGEHGANGGENYEGDHNNSEAGDGVLFWMTVIMMVLVVTVMKGTISCCHHGDGKVRGGNGGDDHSGDNDGADGDNVGGDHMMLMAPVGT